jgi:hypothetical protein
MEHKQLASYWIAEKVGIIIENLLKGYYKSQEEFDADWHNVFNQAEEMERQQIIDAHFEGWGDAYDYLNDDHSEARQATDYYDETYGTK